jgi:hypothetical protein
MGNGVRRPPGVAASAHPIPHSATVSEGPPVRDPDDVQEVAGPVLGVRLGLAPDAAGGVIPVPV